MYRKECQPSLQSERTTKEDRNSSSPRNRFHAVHKYFVSRDDHWSEAIADYSQQEPGVFRKFIVADLPELNNWSLDNGAKVIARPDNDAFSAVHGSWNRARRGGYEVVCIPMCDG
jgi:hypothetical protein